MSGTELLEKIHDLDSRIPVILMTAYADLDLAVDAIRKGAFDFIIKPSPPEYMFHAIKKAVQRVNLVRFREDYKNYLEDTVRQRTHDLEAAKKRAEKFSMDMVNRLTTIAGDIEGDLHLKRIGMFTEMIARKMHMNPDFVYLLKHASPMHDIGKIGIAEAILVKKGSLTSNEFDMVKTHTTQGQKILSGSEHPVLKMAESIALNHHERWDGTGYPEGIEGEGIPLEGRIVMLADLYDSLRSERPYKAALDHDTAFRIITEGDGRTEPRHFDPDVLNSFVSLSSRFEEVFSFNH